MTVGTLRIDGRKFRVISEEDYKELRAAARSRQRQVDQDAHDLAIAQRRLKDPKRKAIPLARLKTELGL